MWGPLHRTRTVESMIHWLLILANTRFAMVSVTIKKNNSLLKHVNAMTDPRSATRRVTLSNTSGWIISKSRGFAACIQMLTQRVLISSVSLDPASERVALGASLSLVFALGRAKQIQKTTSYLEMLLGCVGTYTQTHIHTHIHIYIYIYIHTHTYIHTYIHT
jgi:hypothetical protein